MAGAMVISEWHVANTPNGQGEYIKIRGRAPGLFWWLLSLLGVERGVQMVATSQHIKFQEGDLGGSSTRIIHMDKISSTYYGYKRPWIESATIILVLAGPIGTIIGMVLNSEVAMIFGLPVSILIAALYYYLNKRMTVGLVEQSGVVNEVVFKRSVLEGVNLDEQSAASASDIMQWLMDSARTGSAGSSSTLGSI